MEELNEGKKFFDPMQYFYSKDVIKRLYERLRRETYVIIYASNTFLGTLFDICLLLTILLSVLLVMLESVETINYRFHGFLAVLEWVITVFFTIEYILRLLSNPKPLSYVFSFYGIVDFVSITPMYLSFIIPGSKALSTIRIFRLLRIFRVLDLMNFTKESNKLIEALKASSRKILVFIYFVLITCVFLGTVMYLVESKESGFSSIPRSIYWCVVTMTTVGYGDIAPATTLGQMIATMIMIIGYGIIAVPTGIVSSEYTKRKIDVNKKVFKKVCPSCGEENFPEDAVYCHKCGEMLEIKEM